MFFLSPELEADFPIFEQIWAQIGKTQIKSDSNEGDAG
jgi:DNA-binding transcriptional regulator YhcF (GntR family)